jgi:hypothetical protein
MTSLRCRMSVLAVVALTGCRGLPSVPTSLSSWPAHFTLRSSVSRTVVATATYPNGHTDTVTRQVEWTSSADSVATVTHGVVHTGAPGSAVLTVRFGSLTATSEVVVTPMPPTQPAVGPLRVSRRNPRYFETPSGTMVYLTGAHTWNNLIDGDTTDPPAAFDYPRYLAFLLAHGHNFFRLWAWEQSKWAAEYSGNYYFAPSAYLRTGPDTANDGKPRFDLRQFNPAYFERLRDRVRLARDRGIYVAVMLFNGFSVATKGTATFNNPWRGHPFNGANNINGIDGDLNHDGVGFEVQTLENEQILHIEEAYVRRVVDAVNDLDNVLYEISNESDSSSLQWQYHMIRFIKAYEATKPRQHPVGITSLWYSSNVDLFASPADWISPFAPPDDMPVADGTKVILSDTDHLCGLCASVPWVWEALTGGYNPVLMDGYDGKAVGTGALDFYGTNPVWEDTRRNLGYARDYANRMDLAAARPLGNLASTEHCLAVPGKQYLVFIPGGEPVRVNLTGVRDSVSVEWFDPATGETIRSRATPGGTARSFTAPFPGDAVLFLQADTSRLGMRRPERN